MKRYEHEYVADEGKQLVLRKQPTREEHATLSTYEVGHVFERYDSFVPHHYVDDGWVVEEDIPGWRTDLIGYEVVYYHNGYRLHVGNAQVFPTKEIAENYKKNMEWLHRNDEVFIEKTTYAGLPLSESKTYNGKPIVDKEHYFGLDAHNVGEYFTEDMVNYFMDLLPPACWRSDCAQIGEPDSSRIDEDGNARTTYSTFKKIAKGVWEYCGDCFRGENYMHGKEPVYV